MSATPDGPAAATRIAQGAPSPSKGSNQDRVISDGARAALGALGILLVILIPAVLTLRTVEDDIITRVHSGNPTPYGYTISLLLYLVPIATLVTWFFRKNPSGTIRRTAFWWTVGLLAPAGFALDLVFGNLFFSFPNAEATLQIFLPGYSFATGGLVYDLPIEEFIFYVSGFIAILLVYIWCNEVWVPAYAGADYDNTAQHPAYLIQLHWHSAVYGLIALAVAVAHKKLYAPVSEFGDYREGFPLYFAFLMAASLLPSMLLYRTARPFINWRAFSVTLLWVLLTSLLWEATLASPFAWWRYHHQWMMGLHINAWADLPVEAAILWVAVTYTTTIVYETIKLALHLRHRAS